MSFGGSTLSHQIERAHIAACPLHPLSHFRAAALTAAVVVTALAAAACGGRTPSTPDPAAPARSRIVALGDSLTAGYGVARSEAYPAILQSKVDEARYPADVINSGVSGDTTAEGLARVDAALAGPVRVLILALGANDGLRGVPIAMIERNLSRIMEIAQERGVSVLLCGMETPPLHGLAYTIAFHNLFPALSARYRTALVPFVLAGVIGNPNRTLPDGVHPNAAGHRVMADAIWRHLEPLIRSS